MKEFALQAVDNFEVYVTLAFDSKVISVIRNFQCNLHTKSYHCGLDPPSKIKTVFKEKKTMPHTYAPHPPTANCVTMIQAETHQLFQGRAFTSTILVKLWNYKLLWLLWNIVEVIKIY